MKMLLGCILTGSIVQGIVAGDNGFTSSVKQQSKPASVLVFSRKSQEAKVPSSCLTCEEGLKSLREQLAQTQAQVAQMQEAQRRTDSYVAQLYNAQRQRTMYNK